MTARSELVTLLETALAGQGIVVIPFLRSMEPAKPTVMVRIDEVVPGTVTNAMRTYNFGLICLVPQTTPGTADDALDDLLEDVIFALEGSAVRNMVIFNRATRATFEDKFPAYQVDTTVHIQKA